MPHLRRFPIPINALEFARFATAPIALGQFILTSLFLLLVIAKHSIALDPRRLRSNRMQITPHSLRRLRLQPLLMMYLQRQSFLLFVFLLFEFSVVRFWLVMLLMVSIPLLTFY